MNYRQGVIGTADDTLISKKQVKDMGYYCDNFIDYFCREKGRKPPIINRGFWARVARVWMTVIEFIQKYENCQIVSLGAGMDTTFWNMRQNFPERSFVYIEIDHEEVVRRKIDIINRQQELQIQIGDYSRHDSELLSEIYKLVSIDLTQGERMFNWLRSNLDPNLPTLFIAECVFVYMEGQESEYIFQQAGLQFENSAFLIYDIINPDDSFGRMMIENLQQRGILLKGIRYNPNVEIYSGRFRSNYASVQGYTMLDVYRYCLQAEDRQRIERLEWVDEFEEWNILLSHYIMLLACKGNVELNFRLA